MDNPINQGIAFMDEKQLYTIRRAYDKTVSLFREGIDPMDAVPVQFKNSPEFKAFMEDTGGSCGSGSPEIREYLDPRPEMNFLDCGCCANLANYRLDRWPSTYYGVDISPELINAMKGFAAKMGSSIGGLWVADLTKLPFPGKFFDFASAIGIFEYCGLEYIKRALMEISRVLKPAARMVIDIPNPSHRHCQTMVTLEEYMGRPHIQKSREDFERTLADRFSVEKTDDSKVMIRYFAANGE